MSSVNHEKNWTLNDSGILRKKEVSKEELLVFGYSCKLFRDDQRALYIDQGKHLIPWMGDESLKIDRYDGRGTLYDLSIYEPQPHGQDQWLGLSSEERYVEQMCDEERYRALTTNEDEEALYQEEELKRLQQALAGEKAYGQVGFTYSEENKEEEEKNKLDKEEVEDEDDTPFIAPHELDIPVNMVVPEKTKLNAIIERTAQFICEQGAQMEVLLKMKQANNPQFEFLSFGSPLHPYYRHVFMAIKTGRYCPQAERQKSIEEKLKEDANTEHYLHPSLATTSIELPQPAPVIPNINYKPSSDCAYSMLVNKIKEKQTNLVLPVVPPLLPKEPKLSLLSSPLRTAQQPSKTEHNESSELVESTSASVLTTTVSNSTLRKRRKKARAEQALVDSQYYVPDEDEETCMEAPGPGPIETPAPHLQLIIDKMASYVAKNGIDFEAIVKSKADPRFSFLEETHEFHPYYRQKVNLYMKLNPQQLPSEQSADSNGISAVAPPAQDINSNLSNEENSQDAQSLSKPVSVCFSIKKPKETESLENRSALPMEESSDGESSDGGNSNTSKSSKSNQELARKSDLADKAALHSAENNAKWIGERVKDKLSAAAKEKLLAKEREKQIQQERKKRAAAFLNLLQKDRLVTSNQLKPAESGSLENDNSIAEDVESLPSPLSVIAISDSSSDEESNESKKCNGSQISHPLIDLSPSLAPRRRKRTPSPVYDHSKKKKRKHSKSSKKSHAKSSHSRSSSHRKHDRHSKKHHSRSSRYKKHSSKHKRHHDKKSRHKSTSSSSSLDSGSSDSSSSS